MNRLIWIVPCLAFCFVLAFNAPTANAQTPPDTGKKPDSTEGNGDQAAQLHSQQLALRDNYSELEKLLLQMADYLAAEDPHRAALLRKAFELSSENSTRQRFDELVTLLGKDSRASTFRSAAKSQAQVQQDLDALLKLLLSENRATRNRDEQKRIREYLQRVNKVIRKQRAIADQTQRGADTKQQAEKQSKLADETKNLGGDLSEDEATHREPKTSEKSGSAPMDGDSKPGQQPEGKGKPKPAQPDGPPKDGPPMPRDGEPTPGDSKPQLEPEPQQSPAAKRLKAAEQKMREAQKDLEEARRDGAIQKQQDALRRLEQAKAELEQILRQLRMEEDEQQLTQLEARFKAILKLQRKVNEGTIRLDTVPQDDRDADDEIEASRLARSQNEIIADVDKSLLLLREEGTAVAMTEVVTQMRDDMQQVAGRLSRELTGELTQSIEQDIVLSLEEILSALDKAIKDADERRQQGKPGAGMPADPPLVDTIAELKMLRSMQNRVRRRTAQYNKMIGEGTEQATKPELVEALRQLSGRQQRIFRATRDIATGKNR